jgi:hypothetical protein
MVYLRTLHWTGLGCCFLIVVLVLECYPLVNRMWSDVVIFDNPRLATASVQSGGFDIFLGSLDNVQNTGNSIAGGLRCALAIVVGFTGVIGRVTPLDIFIFSFVGMFAFELSRQIVAGMGVDQFGTFTVFGFGGWMGVGAGLVLLGLEGGIGRRRPEVELSTIRTSVYISMMGSIVMFVFMPVLAFEGDGSMAREAFTNYTTALSIILSMGASLTTGLAVSLLINGSINARDLQNALIAGFVVGGTASYFITNPAFSIVCGFTGALFQPVFEHCL